MATVVYVDNDDEITSAAARIRATHDGPVLLVLPHGSRISTSRMNFRLLAREADLRGRRLSIVAADGATRALAASAGLPVFGSVAEFESGGPPAPTQVEAELPANTAATTTSNARTVNTHAADEHTAGAHPAMTVLPLAWRMPHVRLPRGLTGPRPSLAPVIAAIAALGLLVAGVAAWVVLPAATITVTPREQPMTPLSISVTADPSVVAPDAVAGIVPARELRFDLAASDTFTVKGRRIDETVATGRVTFGSKDPTRTNRIAAGSVVSTPSGIRFRTTATIVIPKATFVGLTVIPGLASVDVEALNPGPDSNVDANTITVVPQGEDPVLTYVRNRNATTGGSHQEFPRIDQADIDAAMAALTAQLDADFAALVREPDRAPAGLTMFEETRNLGDPLATTDPATLLGKEVDTFDLEVAATGTVVAVDKSAVVSLATERLRSSVSAEHRLVDGSVDIEVLDPFVDGRRVTFPVTARAAQVRVVDAAALKEQIKGKPVPQARAALQPFGDVALTVWPGWVTSIPTLDARIDLRVLPATDAMPSPSPTP
jgi:hypothetical protein